MSQLSQYPKSMAADLPGLIIKASLHFFLPFCGFAKPISVTNPRPPRWFIGILAFSTCSWLAALVVMFVMRSNENAYVIADLSKRGIGKLFGIGNSITGGVVDMLENLTVACGCIGICAV
jgi:hypothetical protein